MCVCNVRDDGASVWLAKGRARSCPSSRVGEREWCRLTEQQKKIYDTYVVLVLEYERSKG